MARDFYQVLGVARTASSAEIRGAFVRLAKRHHPDIGDGSGSMPGRLQEIQQAYRCLSDDESRALHDRALDIEEKRHFHRQRLIRRRLRRYDRRHPRPMPRPYRQLSWRSLVLVLAAFGIAAHLGLRFLS